MSASKVQGKDVVLRAKREADDTYYGFYCAQEVSVNIQVEQMAATSVNSGSFKRNKPGRASWDFTFSGLAQIKDPGADSLWTLYELMDEQARLEGLDLLVIFTSSEGETQTFSGHANPETLGLSGLVGGLAKGQVRFIGDGPLARNASITPDTINEVNRYEYAATGGETFFIEASLVNRTIIGLERESVDSMFMITTGTPNAKAFKYTAASGRFDFDTNSPLGAFEQIVIYYR